MPPSQHKLTVLADGCRPWHYWMRHWGLSVLIDEKILFDSFASGPLLAKRMKKAGKFPQQIEAVVISHAHWDHTGGLTWLLTQKPGLAVNLPPHAPLKLRQKLTEAGAKLVGPEEISARAPGLKVTTERRAPPPSKSPPEQSLLIETPEGSLLIVGCAHPGIERLTREIGEESAFPIKGVLGGFHLMHASRAQIETCAETLAKQDLTFLAPTHCTGWQAEKIFKKTFPSSFRKVRETATISWPLEERENQD